MLAEWAAVGERGEITNAESADNGEQYGNGVGGSEWTGTGAIKEPKQRERHPGSQAKSNQTSQQIGVSHEDEVPDTAYETHA